MSVTSHYSLLIYDIGVAIVSGREAGAETVDGKEDGHAVEIETKTADAVEAGIENLRQMKVRRRRKKKSQR